MPAGISVRVLAGIGPHLHRRPGWAPALGARLALLAVPGDLVGSLLAGARRWTAAQVRNGRHAWLTSSRRGGRRNRGRASLGETAHPGRSTTPESPSRSPTNQIGLDEKRPI